jgi:hypothetical protein
LGCVGSGSRAVSVAQELGDDVTELLAPGGGNPLQPARILALDTHDDSQDSIGVPAARLDEFRSDCRQIGVEITRPPGPDLSTDWSSSTLPNHLTLDLGGAPARDDQPRRRVERLLDHDRQGATTIRTTDQKPSRPGVVDIPWVADNRVRIPRELLGFGP